MNSASDSRLTRPLPSISNLFCLALRRLSMLAISLVPVLIGTRRADYVLASVAQIGICATFLATTEAFFVFHFSSHFEFCLPTAPRLVGPSSILCAVDYRESLPRSAVLRFAVPAQIAVISCSILAA